MSRAERAASPPSGGLAGPQPATSTGTAWALDAASPGAFT